MALRISTAAVAARWVSSLAFSIARATRPALAVCSSVAPRMLWLISAIRSVIRPISPIVPICRLMSWASVATISFVLFAPSMIASMAARARWAICTPEATLFPDSLISFPISLVDEEDRSASLPTSSATTAKPRPCSPARAASMAAFRASRLVWSAMSPITPMMPPICSEEAAMALMASTACPTASTPPWALPIDSRADRETCPRAWETSWAEACTRDMPSMEACTPAAWLWA